MQTRIIIGIVLIVGLVGYLSFIGFEEGRSYYLTCDEVAERLDEVAATNIKLAGNVVEGSIRKDGDILVFELEYEGAKFPVRYVGLDPVPDTFKDGVQAVVDGQLNGEGVFEGRKIQAKCASKYEAEYGNEPEAGSPKKPGSTV
jgi:cytochrome c-type biogenesis protein CcmE